MTDDKRSERVEEFAKLLEANSDPNVYRQLNERICCNGHHCGCQGATVGEYLAYQLRSSINDR